MSEWEGFKLNRLPSLRAEFDVRDYQAYSAYKALNNRVSVLALPTGCGKTICSYLSYLYYKERYPGTKLIVVTTKSAVLQFESELYKFFDVSLKSCAMSPDMHKGTGFKTYKEARESGIHSLLDTTDILIMNYKVFQLEFGLIRSVVGELKKSGVPVMLVADEVSNLRNWKLNSYDPVSKKNKYAIFGSVKVLARLVDKVIGLSATIVGGKLEKTYMVYSCLGIQLTRNKEAFLKQFCTSKINYAAKARMCASTSYVPKTVTGYKNIEEFNSLLLPTTVQIAKSDIDSSLPSYVVKKVYLEHDALQKRLIRRIYREGCLYYEGKVGTTLKTFLEPLVSVGYVERILLDPSVVLEGLVGSDIKNLSPKSAEVVEILSNQLSGEKVVIYSHSKRYANILKDVIEGHKDIPDIYKKVLSITGDISGDEREASKVKFTDSKDFNVMLITNAGIEAINLQAASVLILGSLPMTGGDYAQLAGRLARLGSKHTSLTLVPLIIKDSQDEDSYKILNQQLYLMGRVSGGEIEKGLLDKDVLDNEVEGGLLDTSREVLLLGKRSSREAFY